VVDAHQEHPYDPGPQGLKGHQQELTENLRRGKNQLKPLKDSDPDKRYNFVQRIARKLQGR
jgi:hypothetical protein